MYVLRPHALLIYNNLTFTKRKYLKNDNEKKKMSSSKFYGSGEQKLDALAFDLSRTFYKRIMYETFTNFETKCFSVLWFVYIPDIGQFNIYNFTHFRNVFILMIMEFWERDKGGMEETNFDCLPDDLIIRIFKNVSAEDLCTIYNVSKRFRRLAFDRSLVRWESPIARLSPCKPRKPLSRRMSRECQQKHRITSYRYSHILCPVDLSIEFHMLNVYVHIL